MAKWRGKDIARLQADIAKNEEWAKDPENKRIGHARHYEAAAKELKGHLKSAQAEDAEAHAETDRAIKRWQDAEAAKAQGK